MAEHRSRESMDVIEEFLMRDRHARTFPSAKVKCVVKWADCDIVISSYLYKGGHLGSTSTPQRGGTGNRDNQSLLRDNTRITSSCLDRFKGTYIP